MSDIATRLSLELTKVIDCPYPASLSALADQLARANTLTIRACVRDRPLCAVSKLATLVCEALPLWAYTLNVLSCLCQAPEFREALLLQNPKLLNALLIKAISSHHDLDHYSEICVLLLSHPLPESVPLPGAAQSFFLKVFERAIQRPDVVTLKPIYTMLNGACRYLLQLLPVEERQKFDNELCQILSSNGTGQNSMLLLWCFGIVILAEHPDEVDQERHSQCRSDEKTSYSRQWKSASGRKLFGSTNGLYKTINLAYLSVIWATKGDVGVTDVEAIEGIQIAIRTLRFVDQTALINWPRSSALARNTFPRLPPKIIRPHINPTVQLEALCFFAIVAGEGNLPAEIVARYEHYLTEITSMTIVDDLTETFAASLPLFAPQIQESSIQALFANLLNACNSPRKSHEEHVQPALVERITTILTWSMALRSKALHVVSTRQMQSRIEDLLQVCINHDSSCHAYTAVIHQQLVSATIAMLLTLAMATQQTAPALPLALVTGLISKQRQFPQIEGRCSHARTQPESFALSLFQQENTQHHSQHLSDWRDRLKSELESQSYYQRDSIIRSVAQICQDLDTRCSTVEEPLRKEKERSRALGVEIAHLRQRVDSLESQVTDDRFHLDGLEDEKLNITDERNVLATKLVELEKEYQQSNHKSNESLRVLQEELSSKDLEHRSTVLDLEEHLYIRNEDIERHKTLVVGFENDLRSIREERDGLNQQLEGLQHRILDSEQRLQVESALVCNQSEEITQLKTRNQNIEEELHRTETELDNMASQLNNLQITHQELIHSSAEACRDLELDHAKSLDEAITKAIEDKRRMGIEVQEAVHYGQQMQKVYNQTSRDLEVLQESQTTLKEKLGDLNAVCSEQEVELEELRTLRKNVLASMGLATQHSLTIRSASETQLGVESAQHPRALREHRRRKSGLFTQAIATTKTSREPQGLTSTEMEKIANASFGSSDSHSSQSGPTPKRVKPITSLQTPATQVYNRQGTASDDHLKLSKISHMERAALKQISSNRRQTTIGFASSSSQEDNMPTVAIREVKRRGSMQGVTSADFAREEDLTGLALSPGEFTAGTGRIPDDNDDTVSEL